MAALELQRFVDRRQDAVCGMGSSGDISVRQNGKELRRGAAKDSWRIHVPHGARQRGGHGLEGFVRRSAAIRLDQQNAKVALVPVRPRQLVLQHWTHEPLVEQACRPVDDVQGLSLRVVRSHATRRAEDSTARQWGSASQACLCFRPAA